MVRFWPHLTRAAALRAEVVRRMSAPAKPDCVRVLLPTTDFPPMTGGIQLLLDRLVSHSRHRFDVVAPAALGNASLVDISPGSALRAPNVRSHRAEVAMLNVLTVAQA